MEFFKVIADQQKRIEELSKLVEHLTQAVNTMYEELQELKELTSDGG